MSRRRVAHVARLSRRRWARAVAALLLGPVALAPVALTMAPPAAAAPLPASYAATAGGDILSLRSTLLGASIASTDVAHADAAVTSTGPVTTQARAANLGAQVGPFGVADSRTLTAPPVASGAGSLLSVSALGLGTGVLSWSGSAAAPSSTACVTGPLSTARTETLGAGLSLLGVPVLATGAASTTSTTDLVPVSAVHDTRAVRATAQGSVAGLTVLGVLGVSTLTPTLTATATSGPAASATLTTPAVTVTGGLGGPVVLTPGVDAVVGVPGVGTATFHLASSAEITAAGGVFSVPVLRVTVSLAAGTGTVALSILPLSVSATAPTGGVECDTTAPTVGITAPAAGSTVATTTPTISGTSDLPSATVSVSVDGGAPVSVPTAADGSWSTTSPTLGEGPHSVAVTATDPASNSTTVTSGFTVDVPPTVAITAPPSGAVIPDTTPTVTGTSAATTGTVSVVVDGGAPTSVPTLADGSWSTTLPTLGDGTHTVVASVADAQGATATASTTFTVDSTAPVVAVTAPATGSTVASTTPTISGTSDLPSASVSVVVDGGAPVSVPTDATGAWSTAASPLAQGPHTVTVTATDPAGNAGTASTSFTVDTVPPAVAVTAPATGSTVATADPTVSGTSEVLSGSVSVDLDGTVTTVPTDATGGWSLAPTGLADGPHTVTVTATDPAGNSGTATSTFTVDTTPPAVAVLVPATGSVTNDATPTYEGTSDVLSGSLLVSVDGAVPVPVSTSPLGTWSLPQTTALGDGPHTVTATATDAAGNAATAGSTFTVDTTAPAVAVTGPVGPTNSSTPTLTGTSDQLGRDVTVTVAGLPLPLTATVTGTGTWTATVPTPLVDGPHAVTATVTNPAGTSSTATATVTVDTLAPVVTVLAPADGSTIADPTPVVAGTSDLPSSTVRLSVDGGPALDVATDAVGAWTTVLASPLADGPHVVTVTATDAAGNTGSGSAGFTVDTVAPVLAITAPADGSVTADRTPTVTGTTSAGQDVVVRLDGTPVATVPAGATGDWSWTPTVDLTDGPHTVTGTATDLAGNTSSATVGFTVDTLPPVLVVSTPVSGSTVTDRTPDVTGTTDLLGGSVTVVVDGGTPVTVPAGATGDWTTTTPTLADGPHTVTVSVTDAADNTTTVTRTFTVDATPPAMTITSPLDGSSTTDTTPAVTGSTDATAATVVVTLDGGPAVPVLPVAGTWTLPLTTPLADGAHTVSATATDAAGNAVTVTSTFTVDTTAPVVVITSPADGSTVADTTPTITGTTDTPSRPVQVTVDGGTALTVTPAADGTWSVTPTTPLGTGPHTVVATQTDAAGNTGSDSAVVTVDPSVPSVAVTAPASGTATRDTTPTVTGTSSLPNQPVSVSLDGAPGVVVLAGADGSWTWTPLVPLAEGSHTVSATVTSAAGTSATATSTFVVDTTAPTVAIGAPAAGAVVGGQPVVSGTSGGTDGRVTVVVDGRAPVSVTTAADGTWSLTVLPGLAAGAHTVTASVADLAGNTATTTRAFVVDLTPPAVQVTSPAPGSTTSPTPVLTGTVTPGSTVTVSIDGGPGRPATVSGDTWTLVTGFLPAGPHTALVTAVDAQGNRSVTTVSFTVAGSDSTGTGGTGGSGGSGGSNGSNGSGGFGSGDVGTLPRTGADALVPLGVGLLLVVAGGLLVLGRRVGGVGGVGGLGRLRPVSARRRARSGPHRR